MALFLAIVLLELWPMVTLIRWRMMKAKQQPIDLTSVPKLQRVRQLQLVLLLAMPFVAAGMARGIGFGGSP